MELSKLTVKELRTLAKEHNIAGRWDMIKLELIIALNPYYSINEPKMIKPEGSDEVTDTTEKSNDVGKYLENLEVGTIMAFNLKSKDFKNENECRVMSGKFIGMTNTGNFAIQSKLGTKFIVPREDILWVKTGTKWPKWLYTRFERRGA